MSPAEGLALVEPRDLERWHFGHLFLKTQPVNTSGLARRLDPEAFYLACRWDYAVTSRSRLRESMCLVVADEVSAYARPVDWGPAEWTGRAADLSPGLAAKLNVLTGGYVQVYLL